MSEGYNKHCRHISDERKARGFTGVWIPCNILEFDGGSLSLTEIHILVEIQSLCLYGKYHNCIVTNKHFSDIVGCSERTVERAILHLQLLGLIDISISTNNSGRIRTITFNESVLQPIEYGQIDYEVDDIIEETDNLSDADNLSNVDTTICRGGHDILSNSTDINKENNKETKERDSALSSNSSETNNTRRNFRKEHEVLEDKLNSGEVIDAEKNKKKLSPAEKLQNNCLGEINKRAYTEDEKELLREYFLWASSGTDVRKIKSLDLWRSKLNALEQIAKSSGDKISDIVQQSIDNKWYKFEQVNRVKTTAQHHEPLADEVITGNREEAQKRLDAKRAAGAKVY